MKFFGDGGAADNGAAFEDERLVALFREIESSDESVVAAAENDDVALRGHAQLLPVSFRISSAARRPGSAHDAAAGMRGRAAHVQFFNGSAVTRPARGGTQEEKLLERKFALKDVAFGEAGLAFDIQRSDELLSDD